MSSSPGQQAPNLLTLNIHTLSHDKSRIQTFILYTLGIDYNTRTSAFLHPSDRDFFLTLGRWFVNLHHTFRGGAQKPSPQQVNALAPLLLRLIYAPTSRSLPIDLLVTTTIRFLRSRERQGRYKSCVTDVLREDGLPRLAEKLFLDDTEVLRDVAKGASVAANVRRRIRAISGRYFEVTGPALWRVDHYEMFFVAKRELWVFYLLNEGGELRRRGEKKQSARRTWRVSLSSVGMSPAQFCVEGIDR